MPRYIDLSNPKILHTDRDGLGCGVYHIPPELPTLDLVEVVRCKDCAECEYDEIFNQYWCHGYEHYADYYCADGERREKDA